MNFKIDTDNKTIEIFGENSITEIYDFLSKTLGKELKDYKLVPNIKIEYPTIQRGYVSPFVGEIKYTNDKLNSETSGIVNC